MLHTEINDLSGWSAFIEHHQECLRCELFQASQSRPPLILQVAGDSPSGLSVVEKAQSAVNTVKIITALNEISDILKV